MLESALVPFAETRDGLVDTETGELIAADDAEIKVMALLEEGWKALANARSIQEMSLLRDHSSIAKRFLKKRGMSLEAQNEAAKLHLGASLRMGDWFRNSQVKTYGARGTGSNQYQKEVESQNTTSPTYTDLGVDKRDAFRLQRLWDWEQETQGASRAVQELLGSEKPLELSVQKLETKAVQYYKRETRIQRIAEISQGNTDLSEEAALDGKTWPVIYADPPWRYDHQVTDNRAIENQYPTMSIDEICALPISEIASPDAIIFLWATSPKLAQAFLVIQAWGFEYVTCAIWDKIRMGQGYYFRQQHELLLVAKRGNIPVPLPAARPSWSIYQEQRTEHSAKPAKFAEVIEAMYPDLPKIELFCRSPREGWAVWGNQAHVV
jgi:N6-adenosine-specific RNA methylase IME4